MQQQFKYIEIAIDKFYDEAIPHHKNLLKLHKINTHKLATSGNITLLNKEIRAKKRVIRQLKDLLYELDTLRTRVEDADLDIFDEKTFALRKTIATLIKDYNSIEKQALMMAETENSINENIENEDPFAHAAAQLQLECDVNEIRLQEDQNQLNNMMALESDIDDLHQIYVDIHGIVHEQAEHVDQAENNVEEAQANVERSLLHLIAASRWKEARYPLTGALLGSLVGGPVGMAAGFKVGGAAAIGCGVIGFASGRFFTNRHCLNASQGAANDGNDDQNESQTCDDCDDGVDKKYQ